MTKACGQKQSQKLEIEGIAVPRSFCTEWDNLCSPKDICIPGLHVHVMFCFECVIAVRLHGPSH